MKHVFGKQLKRVDGIFDDAPFAKTPLVLSGEEAARIARLKNARAFASWAISRPKVRIGRNRYSGPAVVRELEKEALIAGRS
jgi:hypothetical protein